MEKKNMAELKLRQLHRGYILTDFDGNEVGCKDSEQAIDEIKKLIYPEEKPVQPIAEKSVQQIAEKPVRKPRTSTLETRRQIFEKAKEQISSIGRVNKSQIARDLGMNASNVGTHINAIDAELDELIKKWQEEKDRKIANTETKTNVEHENTVI